VDLEHGRLTDERLRAERDRPDLDATGLGAVAGEQASFRITESVPIVNGSVQMGTVRERMTTPGPIFAPRARR
jgi:hypothetical protein